MKIIDKKKKKRRRERDVTQARRPCEDGGYTMEYYSAIKKKTFESVLMRWMKLEPIIQSEVSQKEKHHS